MHELKRLFVVLIQNFLSLQIVFVIVGENGFDSGICLHPFVLLDLFDSVTLVWVFDKHVSNQVFAFCGGNEVLRLTSKVNIKFAAAVNLIKLDSQKLPFCGFYKENATKILTMPAIREQGHIFVAPEVNPNFNIQSQNRASTQALGSVSHGCLATKHP